MRAQKERVIACRDVLDRTRSVRVFADAGRVVVVGPPGETAILTVVECGQLRDALLDAELLSLAQRVAS